MPSTMPPAGEYRFDIRRGGVLVATETERLEPGSLVGVRIATDGTGRFEAEARLDSDGLPTAVSVRYARGPFSRSAKYETEGEIIRGQLSAMAAREVVVAKLGRLREVDADLVMFKALIIARIRAREQALWVGRVATVDPATLAVSSFKQTYRTRERGLIWTFEPRMGDADEIEIDSTGRIARIARRDGSEVLLAGFRASS